MNYSFDEIIINNRPVFIKDILSKIPKAYSPFEETTFAFIKEWLSKVEDFKLFTSGSTGTPKEIVLSRNHLKLSANRTISALQLKANQTALVCLDTKYIAGKMMLVRALEGNLKIIAIEPSSNPLKNLMAHKIDFAALVPMQLQEILNDTTTRDRLNTFTKIIIGGAPINNSLNIEIKKLNCEAYATYGMTETVSHIALQRLNGENQSDYFKILNGIAIAIDERGCLVIEIQEFQNKFITNDSVELIDDTHFRWLGRWDNIINSGGYKISPEKLENEIEKVLEHSSLVRKFFITSIADKRLNQKLALVVEGEKFTLENETKIFNQFKSVLHPYEIPKEILFLSKFILTETGKINRPSTLRLLA